jgi:hypothetical protein
MRWKADHFELGDWNATCFECGHKFKASQMRKHWQGYYVCERDWEPRHPQDFVSSVPDVQTPPWVQPIPGDTMALFCTPNGRSSIPFFAEPGCAIPGFTDPLFDPTIVVI